MKVQSTTFYLLPCKEAQYELPEEGRKKGRGGKSDPTKPGQLRSLQSLLVTRLPSLMKGGGREGKGGRYSNRRVRRVPCVREGEKNRDSPLRGGGKVVLDSIVPEKKDVNHPHHTGRRKEKEAEERFLKIFPSAPASGGNPHKSAGGHRAFSREKKVNTTSSQKVSLLTSPGKGRLISL